MVRVKPRAGDAPAARRQKQHRSKAPPLSLFRTAGKAKTTMPMLPKSDLSRIADFRPPQVFKSFAEAINEDMRDGGEERPAPVNLSSALRGISASSKTGQACSRPRHGRCERLAGHLAADQSGAPCRAGDRQS
jgi:hypothetical protein